jgi:hypothetical protein
MLGEYQVTLSSEVTNMKWTFRKRVFLNSIESGYTSFILAEAESSHNGAYKFGNYILRIADCHRVIDFEFFLGSKRARRRSLAKINLLIDILTRFRDALVKEHDLIEKHKKVK